MKILKHISFILIMGIMMGCNQKQNKLQVEVYETSAEGNNLTKVTEFEKTEDVIQIEILPEDKYQPDDLDHFDELYLQPCLTPDTSF